MSKNSKGFTLIEMLVVLGLIGIVIVLVGNTNLFAQMSTQENIILNEQLDAMRYFMNTIVPHIRAGKGVQDASGSTSGVLNPEYIRVELPSGYYWLGLDVADHTLWVSASSTAADTGSHAKICSRIGQLSVDYNQADALLHITIESLEEIPGITHGLPIKLETTVLLRNAGG